MDRKASIPTLLYGRYSITAWNNSQRNSVSSNNTNNISPLLGRSSIVKYRSSVIEPIVYEHDVDIEMHSQPRTAPQSPIQLLQYINNKDSSTEKQYVIQLLDENNTTDDTLDVLLSRELRAHYMLQYYQPGNNFIKPTFRRNVLQQMIQRSTQINTDTTGDDSSENTTPNTLSRATSMSPASSPRHGDAVNQHGNVRIYIDISFILATQEYKTIYTIANNNSTSDLYSNTALKRCIMAIQKQYFVKSSKYHIALPTGVKSTIVANMEMNAYTIELFDYAVNIVYERLQVVYTEYKQQSTGKWSYITAIKHENELLVQRALNSVVEQCACDKQRHNISNSKDQAIYKCILCNTGAIKYIKKFIHSTQCTVEPHHIQLGITADLLYNYCTFYIELCAYRVCPSNMYRLTWARKIYEKYFINTNLITLVFVSSDIIRFIGDVLAYYAPNNLFDYIEKYVFNYILSYYYTQFIQSNAYNTFCGNITKQHSTTSDVPEFLDENYQHDFLKVSSTLNNTVNTLPKFTDLFTDKYLLYFSQYLERYTNIYHLLCFWLDVRELQQIPQSTKTTDYVQKSILKIYNIYFTPNSIDYIYQVEESLRIDVVQSIIQNHTNNGTMYNQCQLYVERMLYDQYYIQFINTSTPIHYQPTQAHNTADPALFHGMVNNKAQSVSHISTFGSDSSSVMPFDVLLQTNNKFEYFKQYLQHNFCYESLLFWQTIQEYKYLPQSNYLIVSAKKIYNKFLSQNAKQRITYIPTPLIEKIQQSIQSQQITPYLFNAVESILYEYLSVQQYSQYLKSNFYLLSLESTTLPDDTENKHYRSQSTAIPVVKTRRRSLSADAVSRYIATQSASKSNSTEFNNISTERNDNNEPITLELILHHDDMLSALKRFCTRSLNIENLNFYLSVDEYRYIPSVDYMRVQASKIVQKYVLNGSKQQVNLPYNIQSYIIKHYKQQPKSNLFYYAQQNIEHLLISHVIPAFLQSAEFQQFTAEYPDENWSQRPFHNKPILRKSIIKMFPTVRPTVIKPTPSNRNSIATVNGRGSVLRRGSVFQKPKPVMEYKKVSASTD